ncbi:unnamed protein product (macronuclear) [Paramecium tetraurelia]|uniref:PH domain-containing protein n=1 Tax=Paramecium tetraurelia TaxID=5888 RepID=A0C3J7_PARTE|nr:uncharacterized protein GSPATT00034843001 [Paramecium tetraurelia]CAK65364.1 unnamed protein product [Paramecium tetraurelia]|eukprot:XP_001432761.1 hypothetical protein (macronuclear) [Paramecium tetraurelia strain d4-2]
MFQDVISEFRNFYSNRNLPFEDFILILDEFAKLDVRCQLDEQTKKQLYAFISEKQEGIVTYSTVETLVFEFLLQQEIPPYKTNILPKTLGRQAQRLPRDMLEVLTNDFLIQFKNLYKLIENRYGIDIEYEELENLCKELQRTMKINAVEMLRYIQPLVDEHQKVSIKELLELCNDLERIIINQHSNQSNKEVQPLIQNQQIVPQYQHVSTDDELQQGTQRQSEVVDKKEYANIVYQQTDIIIQKKYVNQQGKQHLNEINQAVKKMEAQISILQDEVKQKNQKLESLVVENAKKIEEAMIEKELAKTQLRQFESDIVNKDQQIEIFLQDIDMFQGESNRYQEQCTVLQQQINDYHDQLKSITKIETELKESYIENKKLNEQLSKSKSEITRLTQNNKSLMSIIQEYENKQNTEQEYVQVNVQDQNKDLIKGYEEKLNDLQQQYHLLEQTNTDLEKQLNQNESQIIDLKRELNHYKKLYENLNCENQQLRSSIMPRPSAFGKQFNLGGLGRMSKLSSAEGGFPLKSCMIGRMSSARMSSIRGYPQTRSSYFNPLDDLQSGGLKINEIDETDQQEPDQQQTDQQKKIVIRINPKYEESVFEQINEGEEENDQTVHKIEPNNQETQNQLLQNFDKFWIGLKNKNQQESIFDPQQIQIDENQLYERDFLGIRNDQKVKEYLRIENNVHKQIIQRCFSDSIYRVDSKGKRARRIIYLSEYTFFVFFGEKKPKKLSRNFAIKDIKAIIFSETSPVICCIKIAGCDDLLMETFKRTELNIYLTEIFNSQRLLPYNIEFQSDFRIKFSGQNDEVIFSQVSKRQGYQDQGKASAYKVSTKQGWLHLLKMNFLNSERWKEVFVILTNVGLILFKKPGDFEPILFVSLVDAIVIKDPIFQTHQHHLLKIRYENSEYEYLFSATSAILKDEWHDVIQQTIMEQVRNQKKQSIDLMDRSKVSSK